VDSIPVCFAGKDAISDSVGDEDTESDEIDITGEDDFADSFGDADADEFTSTCNKCPCKWDTDIFSELQFPSLRRRDCVR
jgi:hypothetical protein